MRPIRCATAVSTETTPPLVDASCENKADYPEPRFTDVGVETDLQQSVYTFKEDKAIQTKVLFRSKRKHYFKKKSKLTIIITNILYSCPLMLFSWKCLSFRRGGTIDREPLPIYFLK